MPLRVSRKKIGFVSNLEITVKMISDKVNHVERVA